MASKVFGKIKKTIITQIPCYVKNQGKHKKLILDLTNYVNPISNKKEIFTREVINQMSTKEYSQQENKIFMQMNSIGIPTNSDLILSEKQDYKNNPTSQWIWVLDDTKKNHCDFCLKMEGEIFENFADAPNIPVHKKCGCQLLRCVLI